MKKNSFERGAFTMLFLFVLAVVSANAQTSATAFGIDTANNLVRFNTATPGTVTTVGAVTGLQTGETVVGIDFRPATGELYALGSASRLYTLNRTSGAATFVATVSTALNGTTFGIDFNPTVDRLRVISNTGQNLRINPVTGAANVDSTINGATTSVDAAGYTNNFNGATTTVLYDISAATDTLYTQNPPNNGTLVAVGALGVNVTDVNGFDIVSSEGTAFAALTATTVTSLYTINLTTGAATSVGLIGNGLTSLRGFAVEVGGASNFLVYGLTTANNLVRFNSSRPNTILGSVAITGLQTGESLVGIDFRPATGQLFGVGSASRIYRIDQATGAATFVGALTTALSGTNFGVDFNPVPDRIRIVSDADQNLRANPTDGTNIADGTLAYAAGDVNAGQNPNIVAAGYTNSFGGATSTVLYNIDSTLDILTTQNPPNNGTQNTVGRLGVNVGNEAGLDIAPGNNTALAALQPGAATNSSLYVINLTTGAASLIGPIGGAVIRDIAIGRSTASGAATSTVDYDGDGRTDLAVYRLSQNTFYFNRSSNNSLGVVPFGLAESDIQTPGDYDGDGRTDISLWRTTNGFFYSLRSSDNTFVQFKWGQLDDEPVARDYDGDGRTDYAVVRRENGGISWYINNSSNASVRIEQFGLSSDTVAPGDYDGDGRFDLAIHRGVLGQQATFFIQRSTAGFIAIPWGLGGDLVVPGDYDGDGRTDYAVVRQGTPYIWYVLQSSNNQLFASGFGTKPHITTQGDYDGDGKTDLSVFDPENGIFYYFRSSNSTTADFRFGQNGDDPIANYDTH